MPWNQGRPSQRRARVAVPALFVTLLALLGSACTSDDDDDDDGSNVQQASDGGNAPDGSKHTAGGDGGGADGSTSFPHDAPVDLPPGDAPSDVNGPAPDAAFADATPASDPLAADAASPSGTCGAEAQMAEPVGGSLCELKVPEARTGAIDFNKVSVVLRVPSGSEAIAYVASADKCDPLRGGWYYDVDPAVAPPKRLHLCPATCNRIKSATAAQLDVRFGCKTLFTE